MPQLCWAVCAKRLSKEIDSPVFHLAHIIRKSIDRNYNYPFNSGIEEIDCQYPTRHSKEIDCPELKTFPVVEKSFSGVTAILCSKRIDCTDFKMVLVIKKLIAE